MFEPPRDVPLIYAPLSARSTGHRGSALRLESRRWRKGEWKYAVSKQPMSTDFRRTVNGDLVDAAPPFTSFELASGEAVRRREDGTYEIFGAGVILREIG